MQRMSLDSLHPILLGGNINSQNKSGSANHLQEGSANSKAESSLACVQPGIAGHPFLQLLQYFRLPLQPGSLSPVGSDTYLTVLQLQQGTKSSRLLVSLQNMAVGR